MSIDTYYTVLGVSEGASKADIKVAYRELIRQVHPDSVPNASPYWKQAAEEKTKEINEAYSVLSDTGKRREYDRLIAEARRESSPQASPSSQSAPAQQTTAQAPQSGPVCSRCGSGLYPSGYCPACQKFGAPASAANSKATQSSPSRAPRARSGLESLFVVYFYVFCVIAALAALRALWFAASCCGVFAASLCWKRIRGTFPRFWRWSIAGLVVSDGFFVADITYPEKDTSTSQTATVLDGKYSSFPCATGQLSSPIDRRPCGPRAVPTAPAPPSQASLGAGAAPQKDRRAKAVVVSSDHDGVHAIGPDGKYYLFPAGTTPDQVAAHFKKLVQLAPKADLPPTRTSLTAGGQIPAGAFSVDPMDRYGRTKSFMGTVCSWDNVGAQPRKDALETGRLQDHTFMISPAGETCFVWDRDVGQFSAEGAVRGEPIVQHDRIVAYRRPDAGTNAADEPNASYTTLRSSPDRPEVRTARAQSAALSPTSAEQQSMESACSNAKYLEGPSSYDRCLARQLADWRAGPREPSLSGLSATERQSIESACSNAKYLEGAASYDRCLTRQLADWQAGSKEPDLSALNATERQSMESACSNAKYLEGAASYDRCLARKLAEWRAAPREPNLSSLSPSERQSMESACSNAKYLEGPASYNRCLTQQLKELSSYHQ